LRTAIAASALFIAVAQVGCASNARVVPYPAEWASVETTPDAQGCPDLQGMYVNEAMAAFPPGTGKPPSLAATFGEMAGSQTPTGPAASGKSWPNIPHDAVSVQIEQGQDSMTVTFVDPAGRRTPLSFRRYRFLLAEDRVDDLFSCPARDEGPTLRFFNEPAAHARVSIVAIGGGGTTISLLRAVDGSLVVNWRRDDITVTRIVLGSRYHAESVWYRYPSLRAQATGAR
jgi:hypothetical protein